MIIANDRYLMNESDTSLYAVTMTLTIKTLHKADFGGYKCISKNSIGDADQTVRLYREYCTSFGHSCSATDGLHFNSCRDGSTEDSQSTAL